MSEKLYYTIGEVSQMFGINPSVLRFWEKEFPQLNPHKNAKGNRLYTSDEIELIRRIHHLTRECGYTLEGVREQLRTPNQLDEKMQLIETLTATRNFLQALKENL